MKSIIILLIGSLIISCNNTNTEQIDDTQTQVTLQEEEEEFEAIQYYYTIVEDLRVREKPSLDGKILTTLKKNTGLIYLDEKSKHTEKVVLRSITYHSPWFKVEVIGNGIIGWVFGGAVSEKQIIESEDCEEEETEIIRQKLKKILRYANLQGKYRLRCNTYSDFYLEGDFNGDKKEDIAILIESDILDEDGNYQTGILISQKDSLDNEPIIFGVGLEEGIKGAEATFSCNDYTWVGIFEVVKKGDTIEPNWNTETENWYEEDEIIPEEKKVYLTSDAMFIHQESSCGGAYIYWKDGKFHWMNLDG